MELKARLAICLRSVLPVDLAAEFDSDSAVGIDLKDRSSAVTAAAAAAATAAVAANEAAWRTSLLLLTYERSTDPTLNREGEYQNDVWEESFTTA